MIGTWRRVALAIVVLGAIVAGAALFQQLSAERQYRRLVADGDRALAAGDSYRAVEAFSGALAFRPGSMVAYLRRGEAYRGQRRYDEAVRDWREATRLVPDAPQPLVALGDLAAANGNFSQAADWYGQANERLKDGDPALHYRLALARYQSGSPGAAIDPLERAVARNDASAEAHYLLGLLYRDTNNPARAIESLEAALAISPGLTAAREELADVYGSQGRAVEEMQQLRILARDGQPIRKVAIGLAEARQGQSDAALGTLTSVLDSAPNDSRVLVAIGRVYLARAERTRDPDAIQRATNALEQALGGTARRSEGLALYGRALYLSGDFVDAEHILREAVATSPVDTEAFAFLADAAEQLGHELIARDALINLDALQGDTVAAGVRVQRARRIGSLSVAAGDVSGAVPYLSRVVDAQPDDWLSLGLLAEARFRLGEVTAARSLIERAIAGNPKDARLQRIFRLVK